MPDSRYDPTLFRGASAYYLRGRPPYARSLAEFLAREAGLTGRRALDVGCGPGIVAVELSPFAAEVVGLDPDDGMLAEAVRYAARRGVGNARWIRGRAEDLPLLNLGRFALVVFAQSFHWTDREGVAELIYDLLEPGDVLALVGHEVNGRPRPAGPPGIPPIPNEAIENLIRRYLGPERRAGRGTVIFPTERYSEVLARTRFGRPELVYLPGRADIVQPVDDVLANVHSHSYAAPPLFGDRLEAFDRELRALLASTSSDGMFWDWPGDTEVILAQKQVS